MAYIIVKCFGKMEISENWLENIFYHVRFTTHKRQYYHSSRYNTKKLKANGKWTCTKTTKVERLYKKNRGLKTYKLIDWTYSKINENEV